jgi:hypothetical protein
MKSVGRSQGCSPDDASLADDEASVGGRTSGCGGAAGQSVHASGRASRA